jgi:predicted Zn-dependent protease
MTPNDTIYRDFVQSKAKSAQAILADLNAFDTGTLTLVLNRTHAAVGLITELNEIQATESEENLVEELGDYYFYLVLLKMHVPSKVSLFDDLERYDWERARYAAGELLDLTAKREAIYARELTVDQINAFEIHLESVEGYFFFMLKTFSITEVEIQAHNMAKLDKRYKIGYTNEEAAARADKAEDKEGGQP